MTAEVKSLPLAGVTVLDLSRVLAGPYCGLLLADMGADVIKIENPDGGDDSRSFSEPSYQGVSTYFLAINRNKRSVALDLKSPAGRDAFLRLVARADVVLENFRTGVMDRLGLGYETLKAKRPGLIYCAISGYGFTGTNAQVPGYDPIAQAESGLMSMIGEADRDPMRTGPSIVDVVTGLYAAQAISAALRQVAVTGEGCLIEAALHETGLNLLANYAGSFLTTGRNPSRTGNANQVAQPADVYEGSDGPFVLACVTEAQFRKLCTDVIRRPDLLEDVRFRRNPDRLRNVSELRELLNGIFRSAPRAVWVERIRKAGVPSGAVATVGEALSSDLIAERGSVLEVETRSIGRYRALRTPVRVHGADQVATRGAPDLGEHTFEVLRDLGGYSKSEIQVLITSGAAGSPTR